MSHFFNRQSYSVQIIIVSAILLFNYLEICEVCSHLMSQQECTMSQPQQIPLFFPFTVMSYHVAHL